jgi:LDH2 family malate/lactate/ureidoglycolate dehydrogenase
VIVAINIEMFRPLEDFKRSVDELIRDIRGSKRLPGVDAIRLPGDQSHAKRAERSELGIPLPAPLVRNLDQLARELQIPPLD